MIVILVSILFGLVGGFAFYWLWRRIIPRQWSARFWRELPVQIRSMVTCEDPNEMLRDYRALLVSLAKFAGRNSLAVMVGVVPMAVLFIVLTAIDPADQLTDQIAIYPPTLIRSAEQRALATERVADGRVDAELADAIIADVAGPENAPGDLERKRAFCASALRCLPFEMLLFETQGTRMTDGQPSLIVRPAAFDRNPFWPYLNDLEVLFMVAAMVGSAGAAFLSRGRAKAAEASS